MGEQLVEPHLVLVAPAATSAVARLVSSAAGSLAIIVAGASTVPPSKRKVRRRLSHIWPVPTGLNSTSATVPTLSRPDDRSAPVIHSGVKAAGVSAIESEVVMRAGHR